MVLAAELATRCGAELLAALPLLAL